MKQKENKVVRWGHLLASPKIAFWVLLPLMVLLVFGTVAQKYEGLYQATHTYFSSFYFMVGFLPLPGGYTLISILGVSLLAKLIFKSDWSRHNSGIILIHLGILFLIVGGILTAFTQKEGFLYLRESEESSFIRDYHQRELIIGRDNDIMQRYFYEDIPHGRDLPLVAPFSVFVEMGCQNCKISAEDDPHDKAIGPAQFMRLSPDDLRIENEENIAGLSLLIKDKEGNLVAKTSLFEGYTKPVFFEIDQKRYFLTFGRAIRFLPFSVGLKKFEKITYPGMDKAKEYSSEVVITDGGVSWEANITMNEPVRYKGYTLYQASYDESSGQVATVLSVVENKGRLFPYISLLISSLGLILHVFLRSHYMRREEDK